VIIADIQIHGYRNGHQLLASSVMLPKDDQAVIDRLSDVAGPLRPKEHFAPYLSTYPLPSGQYYVVARTWQDHGVARAGCVRTMSVLVNTEQWAATPPLVPILRLLDSPELPDVQDAIRITLEEPFEKPLPSVQSFGGSELLEALFLEDVKPVVVFDAPQPELIAVRLLTALWPDLRRRFSMSTFALSPRKIDGRDLDLVFAPMNARSKFSDWPGRRVDSRSAQIDRHRWTGAIVQRVFTEPKPRLLLHREAGLLNGRNSEDASTLRIALLWDELIEKLHQVPVAVLGLLDIANSGKVNRETALKLLEPVIAQVARKAIDTLSAKDAWSFIGATVRKIRAQDMPSGQIAILQLAEELAARSPVEAIDQLVQTDNKVADADLITIIATGISRSAKKQVEVALGSVSAPLMAILISQSYRLASRVANDRDLLQLIAPAFVQMSSQVMEKAGTALLPFLVYDWQAPVAKPVFKTLSAPAVTKKFKELLEVDKIEAPQLCNLLIERARSTNSLPMIREALVSLNTSKDRDYLLAVSICPNVDDLRWLLGEAPVARSVVVKIIVNTLGRATDDEISLLLGDDELGRSILKSVPARSVKLWTRILLQQNVPVDIQAQIVWLILPKIDSPQNFQIARRALTACLSQRFGKKEEDLLFMLVEVLGSKLDVKFVIGAGLGRNVDAVVFCRNIRVFEGASSAVRDRFVAHVDELAAVMERRGVVDLDEAASSACARLMFDSERVSPTSLLYAAGQLVPSLIEAIYRPVSPLIAALFPVLYRELAKGDEAPVFLKFLPFVDWDRCKTARQKLVDSFLSASIWKPGDLALTALRCGDIDKIFKLLLRPPGGERYLKNMRNDLDRLYLADRIKVERCISAVLPDRDYNFD